MYWSRMPNDIPWTLLISHQQRAVVLTLYSWMMGGNSPVPALSQQILPELGVALSWHGVLMNGSLSRSRRKGVHVEVGNC